MKTENTCTFCCCANPLTVKIWSTCNHLSPICLVFFFIYLFWNHSRHIYGDFHSKALKYIVYNATDGYQSHFLNPPNHCCMFVVSVRLNRGTTAVLPPTVNRPAWITSFLGLSRRWLKSACGLCVRACVYAEHSCSRGLWRNPGNPRLWSHFLKNMFSLPVSCGPVLVVFQVWAWRKDRVGRRSYSQSFARPLVLINRLFLILTHIFKRITAASNKGACVDWLGLWPRW